MIDHVLGRPSVKFRKYQVFAVVVFWSAYLLKGNRHGPPIERRLSWYFSKRLTAWQSVIITLLWLYVARNFGKIFALECPEPLANLYSRSYFRATYVTTALDAGFWSAMRIKRKWLRDILSIVFSVYYMICAEQADEKVRKIRSVLTLEHLRVSWNKATTPYLALLGKLQRPRFMRYQPRAIRIPRPTDSSYTDPVRGWLYFDGPISALKKHKKVVLYIPGGGFVAMNPRTHDDALFAWAGKLGLPVLGLDYKKAPEYPYPFALNECFDVYSTIVASKGRCIGFSGQFDPQILVAGDSAGGNLATGVVLMALQSGSTDTRRWLGEDPLPIPAGLVLIYPALDVNIGNWMTDEQMALIRDRHMRNTNKRVLRHKSDDFRKLSPGTPLPNDIDDSDSSDTPDATKSSKKHRQGSKAAAEDNKELQKISSNHQSPDPLKTRLATPSLISYVSDRVLTPEMMRAMIILYIGPHNRPDFTTEYLLSPVLAPDSLLSRFPKTYFLTGERDPLVDDTLIMAGRIRAAKAATWRDRQEMGMLDRDELRKGFDEKEHVEVKLIEGISHGFIQFTAIFPEAWGYIFRVGGWILDCFDADDRRLLAERVELEKRAKRGRSGTHDAYFANGYHQNHAFNANTTAEGPMSKRHHHRTPTASSAEEDRPLEMTKFSRKNTTPPVESQGGPPASHKTPNTQGSVQSAAEVSLTTKPGKPSSIEIPPSNSDNPAADDSAYSETPNAPHTPAEGMARDHPLGREERRRRQSNNTSGQSRGRGHGKRNKSLVSLSSQDDLLDRRMRGLFGGLTRADE